MRALKRLLSRFLAFDGYAREAQEGASSRGLSLTSPMLVPTGPLVGETLRIYGVTMNCLLLVNVPLEVVTVTKPVVAPLGTIALRKVPVFPCKATAAGVPLKETVLAEVNPCPRNSTALPTLPEYGRRVTNAGRLAPQL